MLRKRTTESTRKTSLLFPWWMSQPGQKVEKAELTRIRSPKPRLTEKRTWILHTICIPSSFRYSFSWYHPPHSISWCHSSSLQRLTYLQYTWFTLLPKSEQPYPIIPLGNLIYSAICTKLTTLHCRCRLPNVIQTTLILQITQGVRFSTMEVIWLTADGAKHTWNRGAVVKAIVVK